MEIIRITNRTLSGIQQAGRKGITEDGEHTDCYGLTIIEKDGLHHTILTELPGNHGCSLTNAWSYVANQVYASHLKHIPHESIHWYEYFPSVSRMGKKPTFVRVLLSWDGQQYLAPELQHLGTESPEFSKFQQYLDDIPKLPVQKKA